MGLSTAYVLPGLWNWAPPIPGPLAFAIGHASASTSALRRPRRLPGFNLGAGLSSVGRLASQAVISASSQRRVFGPTRRPGGKP